MLQVFDAALSSSLAWGWQLLGLCRQPDPHCLKKQQVLIYVHQILSRSFAERLRSIPEQQFQTRWSIGRLLAREKTT